MIACKNNINLIVLHLIYSIFFSLCSSFNTFTCGTKNLNTYHIYVIKKYFLRIGIFSCFSIGISTK